MGQRGVKQDRHGGMKPRTFERQLEDLGFVKDEAASAPLGKFGRYVCGDVTVTTMSGKKAVLSGPNDKVKTGQITWDYETIMQNVKELKAAGKLIPAAVEEPTTEKDPEPEFDLPNGIEVGDRVEFSPGVTGILESTGEMCMGKVKWDDGSVGDVDLTELTPVKK